MSKVHKVMWPEIYKRIKVSYSLTRCGKIVPVEQLRVTRRGVTCLRCQAMEKNKGGRGDDD